MVPNSILLPIDGSVRSLWASELSWALANRYRTKVTAQHVIDVPALWEFLAHDHLGFTGSGPYLSAFEATREVLTSLGQTLLQSFETHSQSQGVEPDTIIDDGNVVAAICERATAHDLVVVGHKHDSPPPGTVERRAFVRHSLAERLAHYCPRPLIIVQNPCQLFSSLTLLISGLSPYSASLAGCAELANFMAVPLRVCYWLPNEDEESQKGRLPKLVDGLRSVYAGLSIELEIARGPRGWWLPNIDFEPGTLVVVPLLSQAHSCETPFGTPAEMLVRSCELPCYMLWPETRRPGGQSNPDEAAIIAAIS